MLLHTFLPGRWTRVASFFLAALPCLLAQDEMLDPVEVLGSDAPAEAAESLTPDSSSEAADSTSEDGIAGDTKTPDGSAREKDEKSTAEEAAEAELKQLRQERDLLSMRSSLRAEQIKIEQAALREEKERLALETSLAMERVKADLAEQRAQIDRVSAQVEGLNNQISLANAQMRMEMQTELADLKKRGERLDAEAAVAQKEMAMQQETLRLAETKLKVRRLELETEFAELQAKIAIKDKADEVSDQVFEAADQDYLVEPVVDGVLRISDRRIALNGPIWAGVASHVSERINYFNNQSTEFPIFIVIDSSPGGSVWAGYRILKSMEGSKAPVYVVVKSYAASMAAIITTLAERSYAYPNAMILHHELSWYGVVGNLSQQSEYAEEAKEWWRRLAEPVAAKMGVTLPEFRTLMYEKSSVGDWQEFADVAQKYKWVDLVVDRMWETAIDRNPDRYGTRFWSMDTAEVKRDDKGRPYVELPRLEPFDFYFLYDPDGYYRIPR